MIQSRHFHFLLLLTFSTIQIFTLTRGQLSYADPSVNEGGCIDVPPAANLTAYFTFPIVIVNWPVYPIKLVAPFTGKITYGSQAMLRSYAESFLGRPPLDQSELDRMCLWVFCTGITCTQMGYGDRAFVGVGVPQLGGSLEFKTQLARSPGVLEHPYKETIIWAEPTTYLFVRCYKEKERDWKVLASRPVTNKVKTFMLNLIKPFRFNPALVLDDENFCPPLPPSVAEYAVLALNSFKIFSNDSPLFQKLTVPVFDLTKFHDTLADYYKTFLGPTFSKLLRAAIEHCGDNDDYYGEGGGGGGRQKPLGCKFFET